MSNYEIIASFVIGLIVLGILLGWFIFGNHNRGDLPLINLRDYEKDLLYQKKNGGCPLMPPPMIPYSRGGYSSSENQMLEDNRKEAQKIYDEISRMRF